MTRTMGFVFAGGGVAVCLIGALILGLMMSQGLRSDAAALGFGLLFLLLVAPMVGVGVVTLARSRAEQSAAGEAEALRKLLDMIKTRGRVGVSDAIIELKSDLPSVQGMIYKLVGMGVFSGYVNWDEGILYSEDAAGLHDTTQCKHCGGNLTLAGKGIVKCPFCGTEYFLAQ